MATTKPVNLKGDQPWIFPGRTDAEAEAPVFWSSDAHSWLIGKVPDAGKDWGLKKRESEDEMAGGIADAMNMNLGKLWEMVRARKAWHAADHGLTESHTTGWLSNNSNFIYIVDFSTVIFSYQVFWLSSCLKADIHLQLSGSASGTTWQRDFILLLIIMQFLTNLLFLQSNHWCCVELFMKQLLIICENYKGACHNEHWNNKKDGNSFHLLSFSYVLGVLL